MKVEIAKIKNQVGNIKPPEIDMSIYSDSELKILAEINRSAWSEGGMSEAEKASLMILNEKYNNTVESYT